MTAKFGFIATKAEISFVLVPNTGSGKSLVLQYDACGKEPGRTIETFLSSPPYQIPFGIIQVPIELGCESETLIKGNAFFVCTDLANLAVQYKFLQIFHEEPEGQVGTLLARAGELVGKFELQSTIFTDVLTELKEMKQIFAPESNEQGRIYTIDS